MADHALATIDNPSSALTDFTLIVDLSNMPASWWSAVNTSDGTRGRVYKGDGTTRLAADWIDFDDTAETGLLRVLWSGTLASTGTQELWIEPPVSGNATVAASDTYGSDNAYDSSWEGYWPDGGGNDRTSNGNDMTAYNSPSVGGVSGPIGSATNYNGSDQYSELGSSPVSAYPVTMSVWANPDVLANKQLFTLGGGTLWRFYQLSANLSFRGPSTDGVFNAVSAGSWSMLTMRVTSTETEGYADGAGSGSPESHSVTFPNDFSALSIATQNVNGSRAQYFDGSLSHAQIHSAERGDDWISHEYDQTNDNSTFYTTWTWTTSGGGTTDLTTNEVIGGVPVLDSISLGVEHAATLSEIVAGTPIVDSLPLSITKAISFNEITVDPAIVDQLSVGVAKPLTLNEIVIPAPTVDGVSIDAVRNLLFNEVLSGVPVADQLSISVEHPLTLNEVVSGVPVLESPNIGTTGTTVDLTLNGIVVGIPVVDAVELGLIRNLELNGVENGVPQAERMQLSVVHPVTFNEVLLDVPVVDAATIGLKEFGETSSWRRRRIRYVASFRNRRF